MSVKQDRIVAQHAWKTGKDQYGNLCVYCLTCHVIYQLGLNIGCQSGRNKFATAGYRYVK